MISIFFLLCHSCHISRLHRLAVLHAVIRVILVGLLLVRLRSRILILVIVLVKTVQCNCALLFLVRAPEPQRPQVKPPEDIVRSNHYDPEEDEEYYRKQLSYFDRRNFENKPSAQVPASHHSDSTKPIHSQNQLNFSNYSK